MTDQAVQSPQEDFLTQVERDLIDHIIKGLEGGNLTVVQMEQLARDFLAFLPVKDKEDLLKKLNALGQTYKPAQETYVDFVGAHEEQKRDLALSQMRDHIKSGNIDEAIKAAKGATEQK